MAKQRPKYEELALSLLNENNPYAFKIGRDFALEIPETERTLFSKIEERESGNYIISGLTKKVTELDFSAFTFALGQILYNQSYKYGNTDVNSGIERKKINIGKGKNLERGKEFYMGCIEVTLNDLCRYAFGAEPETQSKKKMAALVEVMDKTPVKITAPNGDLEESWLCKMITRTTRAKDGAVTYKLFLHPIFGYRIKNQFGELPQDIVKRLTETTKKKTAQHYILMRWLSVQDKRIPHPLTIGKLIQLLRMEEYYRENKGKAEKQLISVFESMVKIKLLNKYELEYSTTGRRKYIKKITFHLNPYLIRKPKEREENNSKNLPETDTPKEEDKQTSS